MLRVARVAGRAGLEVGEFGGDRLACDQRAVFLQARYDRGLRSFEKSGRQLRTGLRREAVHPEDVLDTHKLAEQRRSVPRVGEAGQQRSGLVGQSLSPRRFRHQRLDQRLPGVNAVAKRPDMRQQVRFTAAQRSGAGKC